MSAFHDEAGAIFSMSRPQSPSTSGGGRSVVSPTRNPVGQIRSSVTVSGTSIRTNSRPCRTSPSGRTGAAGEPRLPERDVAVEPRTIEPGRVGELRLLTLFGGEHSLGGIPGYEARETTDENAERVALIQHVTLAYLRHALDDVEDTSRASARKNLTESTNPFGRIESK
jgi:hypothetical protein